MRRGGWARAVVSAARAALRALVVASFFAIPAVAFASEGAHGEKGPAPLDYGFRAFNVLVLAGILVYLLKPVLAQFLRDRGEKLAARLSKAEQERDDARKALDDMEARYARLQEQIDGIQREAREDGDRIKNDLAARAATEIEQIQTQTSRMVEDRLAAAKKELKAFAAHLSVEEAERIIKSSLSARQRQKLFDQGIEKLQGRGNGGAR